MTKTYQTKSGSTTYSSRDVAMTPASAPAVSVRSRSFHTASLGVHVAGSMQIQQGQATELSFSMDPVALERKLAVQQVQMELQGAPSAPTTNPRR